MTKNRTHLRHSLEPLRLKNNESDSDSFIERNNKISFSKLTRTGYIPLIPETGFKKKENQDSSLVLQNFMGITDNYFFGVFDGHGTNGAKVSGFLKEIIPGSIKRAFQKSFISQNQKLNINLNFKSMTSWFSSNNKVNQVERYQNLKLRGKMIEEGMNYTQRELK